MNKIEKFEDLNVWNKAMDLCEIIYQAMSDCKDFGFKDQIQRASVSVPSNIAEGYDRQTNKEFIQFLYIDKGSIAEVRTQLYLAQRLNNLIVSEVEKMIVESRSISAMLFNLIETRKNKF